LSNREPIGKCLRLSIGDVIDDVILVTSQSSKSTHSETRTRINYLYVPFMRTLKENFVLKYEAHSDYNCRRRSIWRKPTPK